MNLSGLVRRNIKQLVFAFIIVHASDHSMNGYVVCFIRRYLGFDIASRFLDLVAETKFYLMVFIVNGFYIRSPDQ